MTDDKRVERLEVAIMAHWQQPTTDQTTRCHFCGGWLPNLIGPELVPHSDNCIVRDILEKAP